MKQFGVFMFLLIGIAGTAFGAGPPPAPEINPASATNALALLSGAGLLLRRRRKS